MCRISENKWNTEDLPRWNKSNKAFMVYFIESRTARVNLKEDVDEETSMEGKERQRKAL